MAKVAGLIHILVDGERQSAKGNFNVALSDIERESVVGLDGYHGVKEMHVPAFIEGDITDRQNLDIEKLSELEDIVVDVELANGKVGVLRGATQIPQLVLNVDEGEIPIRFEGPKGDWIQ